MQCCVVAHVNVIGWVAAALLHVMVIGLLVWGEKSFGAEGDDLGKKAVLIEASLQMKSTQKQKQPQKKAPRKKVERTANTTDKAPTPAKEKPKPKTDDFDPEAVLAQSKKEREGLSDDDASGSEPTNPGAFDGSKHGWAKESTGHPWFQKLYADALSGWELPSLETGQGDVHACLRIDTQGRIQKFKLCKSSQNTNIDRSVKIALQRLKKKRSGGSSPVPAELVNEVTKQWRKISFPVQ